MEDENLDDYQRDQLWRGSVKTFYKVYYAESLTNSLIKSWQRWDEIAKNELKKGYLSKKGNSARSNINTTPN